jgi:hypothetical protein
MTEKEGEGGKRRKGGEGEFPCLDHVPLVAKGSQ